MNMDAAGFRATLGDATPPEGLNLPLAALWWDANGDWHRAHECVQQEEGRREADLVHAYLHRKEGDLSNAGYWYRRAGRPVAHGTLAEEWDALTAELLAAAR
jgi:hypothetical protein